MMRSSSGKHSNTAKGNLKLEHSTEMLQTETWTHKELLLGSETLIRSVAPAMPYAAPRFQLTAEL